jgi:NRAMP (natural resistance-associated macrophage protein)-like metal ion transporter
VGGFGYFSNLGPGLITGASDDDPSGIGTYSQVGAAFGSQYLWTALVSLPLASAVQEAAARLGLCTGEGLAALIKKRYPRAVLYGAVALVCGANVFNIGADLGAMAASMRLVVPVPQTILLVAITVVVLALEIFVPYRRYARVLRWLTLSLGAYIVVLFVSGPDWGQVAKHTFIPSIGHGRSALAALIAIFGTTISPYLFFWQASEEVEEEREHGGRPGVVDDGHVRSMRVDVLSGMASAVVVMFAIMVASSVTLHAHGVTTVGTADQAAEALKPIAGPVAGLLFALGIVGTGALAVPVLAGSTAYALAETFGWREGLYRRLRDAEGFYGAIAASMVVGIVLGYVGVDPIKALYLSAILNGVAAPPLILLMLLLSNSSRTMKKRTGGILSRVLLAVAFLVMLGLPVAYLLS